MVLLRAIIFFILGNLDPNKPAGTRTASIRFALWLKRSWRIWAGGYALPVIMVKYGVFRSSLIIGLFWSAWHLPLFWMFGTVQYELSFMTYTMMTVPLAFIYTWIHMGTGGSVLAAILFHGASNTMAGFIPFMPVDQSGGTEATFYIFIGLLWLIVAIIHIITGKTS